MSIFFKDFTLKLFYSYQYEEHKLKVKKKKTRHFLMGSLRTTMVVKETPVGVAGVPCIGCKMFKEGAVGDASPH